MTTSLPLEIIYGLYATRGHEETMEDSVAIKHGKKWCMFLVCDGYNGRYAADCIADTLHHWILCRCERIESSGVELRTNDISKIIRDGFTEMDQLLKNRGKHLDSGASVVCVLISIKYIVFAQLGRCKALAFSNNGEDVVFETRHHGAFYKPWSVKHAGPMPRALGDFSNKPDWIRSDPDITIFNRGESLMDTIILGSEGLWSVMSSEKVCQWLTLQQRPLHNVMVETAENLARAAMIEGSKENISVLILKLSPKKRYCAVLNERHEALMV